MHLSKADAKRLGIKEDQPQEKKRPHYWPFKSSWEKQYAGHLLERKLNDEIVDYRYERASFVLTPASEFQRGSRYIPDFMVIFPDGRIEIHEVKGHWKPGAKAKVKALAHMLKPIPVYVVRKECDGWDCERF